MDLIIQQQLEKDLKMAEYLKQNSEWFKYLNRDSNNYKTFVKAMKDKYHIKVSDKINDAMDNIGLISSVIETLK